MAWIGRHFRNWISWAGMVLAAGALFSFLLLVAIDQFAGHRTVLGILAYVVAPLFFILGGLVAIVGALLQWRRAVGRTRGRAARYSH